jgi:4-hydroxy-tetrahydrodipicolinate synthase
VQALVPTRVQGGETRRHDVIGYFRRIGAELDIPVVAYHNPRTGAALIPEDVVALAELDSVVAFKESSRNMRHVLQLIDSVDRSGRAQYLTTMELLVPSIVLGGSGTTMPPPAAELGRKTIDAFETGDMRTAIELQHEFGEFPSQWLDWGLASVLKAAFGYFGVDIGSHPATSGLSDTAQSEVEAHMKSLSIDGPRRQ